MRGCSALLVQTLEPIAWAEELIEPARAVDHPRLAFLYVIASLCYLTGRIEAAVGYSDAGPDRCRQEPRGAAVRLRSLAWSLYTWPSGSPSGGSSCAAPSSHAAATPTSTSGHVWFVALAVAGSGGEAMDPADGLIEAAEATGNPYVLAFALLAYGFGFP